MQRQITIVMHIFAEIVKMELGSSIPPKSAHMLFSVSDLQRFRVWCRSTGIKKMEIAFLPGQFRERGATKCHDKVYGILGFLTEWPTLNCFYQTYHFFG